MNVRNAVCMYAMLYVCSVCEVCMTCIVCDVRMYLYTVVRCTWYIDIVLSTQYMVPSTKHTKYTQCIMKHLQLFTHTVTFAEVVAFLKHLFAEGD